MANLLQQLKNKQPTYYKNYKLVDCDELIPKSWLDNIEFVNKQVLCKCGASEFFLYVTYEVSDEINKKELPLAPIYLKCSKCQSKNLFFNPQLHGWDAELFESASRIGNSKPILFFQDTGKIIISYSYQNFSENYLDLISEGFNHPENCFDTFCLCILLNKKLRDVISYECA